MFGKFAAIQPGFESGQGRRRGSRLDETEAALGLGEKFGQILGQGSRLQRGQDRLQGFGCESGIARRCRIEKAGDTVALRRVRPVAEQRQRFGTDGGGGSGFHHPGQCGDVGGCAAPEEGVGHAEFNCLTQHRLFAGKGGLRQNAVARGNFRQLGIKFLQPLVVDGAGRLSSDPQGRVG